MERQMDLEPDYSETHNHKRASQRGSEDQPELRAKGPIQKPLQIFPPQWKAMIRE